MRISARRGFVAAAIFAGIAAPTGILTTSVLASAQVTKGAEAISVTIYEVGTPAANPTMSMGGGPASAGGVVVGKGNMADLADGSTLLAFNNGTGTLTLGPLTGGRFSVANLNPVNCKFIANLTNARSSITSGTGVYSAATGSFKINASITGVLPRNSTGGCNTAETAVPAQDTVKASAVGNINLHNG
jgi:hypothetical protein